MQRPSSFDHNWWRGSVLLEASRGIVRLEATFARLHQTLMIEPSWYNGTLVSDFNFNGEGRLILLRAMQQRVYQLYSW